MLLLTLSSTCLWYRAEGEVVERRVGELQYSENFEFVSTFEFEPKICEEWGNSRSSFSHATLRCIQYSLSRDSESRIVRQASTVEVNTSPPSFLQNSISGLNYRRMSSFFGNRPSYVTASWANQRIYPRTEPTFVEPTPLPLRRSSSNQLPPTTPISRTRSSPAPNPTTATSAPVTQAPPPLYFPGANRQRSLSRSPEDSPSLPPNHIPSINSASTRLSIVPWEKHPIPLLTSDSSTRDKVKKWIRLPEIWASLKQEPEVLYGGWPAEFGGKPFVSIAQRKRQEDEEEGGDTASRLSRFSSRRSATSRADSGIVLPRRNSTVTEGRQHPLEPLYRKRIAELNTLITQGTVLPRGWLAMVELMFMVWFVALIVALAQGRGVQTGFLKGVEVSNSL